MNSILSDFLRVGIRWIGLIVPILFFCSLQTLAAAEPSPPFNYGGLYDADNDQLVTSSELAQGTVIIVPPFATAVRGSTVQAAVILNEAPRSAPLEFPRFHFPIDAFEIQLAPKNSVVLRRLGVCIANPDWENYETPNQKIFEDTTIYLFHNAVNRSFGIGTAGESFDFETTLELTSDGKQLCGRVKREGLFVASVQTAEIEQCSFLDDLFTGNYGTADPFESPEVHCDAEFQTNCLGACISGAYLLARDCQNKFQECRQECGNPIFNPICTGLCSGDLGICVAKVSAIAIGCEAECSCRLRE